LISASFPTRGLHVSGQSASNLNAPPEGETKALQAEAIEDLPLQAGIRNQRARFPSTHHVKLNGLLI
tara:strand:+ start:734 stop:934 length:201 start_codon:yes stop_codon:yes gene_type:complete